MLVPSCDFTDTTFDAPVMGGGYLARGATGRWCVVMYAGPSQVKRHVDAGGELITVEEARAKIEAMGDGNYPDF